jgi:hypothetical protein
MTLNVPPAIPDARASSIREMAADSRRSEAGLDFSSTLSGTDGDASEGTRIEVTKGKSRHIYGRPGSASHGAEARERGCVAEIDPATAEQCADSRNKSDAALALPEIGGTACLIVNEPPRAQDVEQSTANDVVGSPSAACHPRMRGGDPVGDALAVLGAGVTRKRAAVASSEGSAMHLRPTQLANGSTSVANRPVISGKGAGLSRADVPDAVPDGATFPIKVVGQETHFQPVADRPSRLALAIFAAQDDPVLPVRLAAATRIGGSKPLPGDVRGFPGFTMRMLEAAEPRLPMPRDVDERALTIIAQAIGEGVQRAVGAPAEAAVHQPAGNGDQAAAVFSATLRSVKLQLNPHSLGVVTVILAARDGEVRVHLEVENAETFGKVEQSRGALSGRLADAGYPISELTIVRTGAVDGTGQDGGQGDAAAPGGGQTGNKQGDTSGGGARDGASQFAATRKSASHSAPSPEDCVGSEKTAAAMANIGRFRPV